MDLNELRDIVPNPIEIVSMLDEYIIGQTDAKKTLAIMLMNRALRILNNSNKIKLDNPLEKNNVMLIGPTGTGKTSLVKALAAITETNITTFDVTSITAQGYVGGKVDDIIRKHVRDTEEWIENDDYCLEQKRYNPYWNHKEVLQYEINNGIIYLDEIDKIMIRGDNGKNDVNGDMVQNELLKLLDGNSTIYLESMKDWLKNVSCSTICMENIVFITGGAFSGLNDIIKRRMKKEHSIGFNSKILDHDDTLMKYVKIDDLIEYGFKPEFLGRIPLLTVLTPLNKDMLKNIMLHAKDSIYLQYKSLFKVFGINLILKETGIVEILTMINDLKLGARALKSIFSNMLSNELYNIYTSTKSDIIIDKSFIQKGMNK